jgi:hypothetical protein
MRLFLSLKLDLLFPVVAVGAWPFVLGYDEKQGQFA